MNAKFKEWIFDNAPLPIIAEKKVAEILRAFVREVNKRAEAKMLHTGKLEGSHHAAMTELLKEWKITL